MTSNIILNLYPFHISGFDTTLFAKVGVDAETVLDNSVMLEILLGSYKPALRTCADHILFRKCMVEIVTELA